MHSRMDEKELISVIVPVYNVEQYLPACVFSLMAQTWQNLEILLVDDGSTDGSGALCDDFAVMDSRVRVIHRENGGLSAARNTGIEAAQGSYLTFVDSDDLTDSRMIACLRQELEASQCAVCGCGFQKFADDAAFVAPPISNQRKVWPARDALAELNDGGSPMITNLVVAWGKLYRRELFSDIRYPEGKLHEDEAVIHHLLWKAEGICMVPDGLYGYRQRSDSIMGKKDRGQLLRHLALLDFLEERLNFFCQHCPELATGAVHHVRYQYKNYYETFLQAGCRQECRMLLRQYRAFYRRYFGGMCLRERVTGGIFCVFPQLYIFLFDLKTNMNSQ